MEQSFCLAAHYQSFHQCFSGVGVGTAMGVGLPVGLAFFRDILFPFFWCWTVKERPGVGWSGQATPKAETKNRNTEITTDRLLIFFLSRMRKG